MAGFNIGLAKDANLSDLANLSAGAANLGLSAASLDLASGLSSLNIQSSGFNALTGLTGNVQAQIDAQRATLFGLLADTADYLHLGGSTLTTAAVSGAVAANLFLDASLNPVTTSTDSFWYSSTAGEIEYPARVEVGGTLQVDSLSLPNAAAISDLSNLAGDYGFIAFNKALGLAAGGNTYRALVAPGPTVEQYFKDDKSLINRVSQTQVVTYARASKALYRNAQGLFVEAANGEPRFDHDANGQCLGLLIEPQRTNYIRYSELTTPDQLTDPQRQGVQYRVLTGVFDRPINAAYFPPSILDLGGSNALTGTISDATRSANLIFFTATSFSITSLAISFYLYSEEVPSGLNVFIERVSAAAINISLYFVERFDLGGGLYRYTYVYPWSTLSTSGTLSGFRVSRSYTKLSGNLFVGPGKGFYVFGGQLESGSFVTSYIRTTGAQITRSADALTLTGATLDTSGTLEIKTPGAFHDNLFELSSATASVKPSPQSGLLIDNVLTLSTFSGSVAFASGIEAGLTRVRFDSSGAIAQTHPVPESIADTALGFYSFRDVRVASNADVMRGRRSNDNAEANFTAVEIADGTLTTWANAGDVFVVGLYDQSGNNRYASSPNQSEQPKIVSNGVLLTKNGKPAMTVDGINDHVRAFGLIPTNGIFSAYVVAEQNSTWATANGGVGGFNPNFYLGVSEVAYAGSGVAKGDIGTHALGYASITQAGLSFYRNGTLQGTVSRTPAQFTGAARDVLIGRFNYIDNQPYSISEFALYPSYSESKRIEIERSVDFYYNITGLSPLSDGAFDRYETTTAIPAIDTIKVLPNGVGHIERLRYWPFQCSSNFVFGGVVT